MRRLLVRVAAVVGVVLIGVGVIVATTTPGGQSASSVVGFIGGVLAFFALIVVLLKIRGPTESVAETPTPWSASDSFARPAPERSGETYPLSSDHLARGIKEAGTEARSAGTVEEGLAVVRPALRETLIEAMGQGHSDRDAARRAVETGDWTDDPIAANVLDHDAASPTFSLRERAKAWLFPERVVSRRVQHAVQEIAETADEALPTVPGQTAPRTVPVVKPRLEELQRGADGRLQRAVDSDVVTRGPEPPEPTSDPGSIAPDEEVPEA